MVTEIQLSEEANLSKVDFSRYQTEKLRAAIEEILSITGNLAFFLRILFPVWAIGPVIMLLLFSDNSAWVRVAWSFYGACSFFFVAAGLGIFFTKRRLLRNILCIVDIVFEVCGKVLDDLGHITSHGVGATAVTLVTNVNNSVIRPIVEGILRSKLGFFSRPLLWMYRGTIGSIIQMIETTLKKLAAKEEQHIAGNNESRRESEEKPKGLIQRADEATLRVRDFMNHAHEVSVKAGRKITKVAMIPSFLLALVIILIAFSPVLLAYI